MGSAYTPGLKVSPGTVISKERRLPMKGDVMVDVGDTVTADTVVARTEIPGVIQTIKVAETLGLEPAEAIEALTVGQGDPVESGRVIAESRSFFGLFKAECKSPYAGTVELISHATGHLGVRLPPTPVGRSRPPPRQPRRAARWLRPQRGRHVKAVLSAWPNVTISWPSSRPAQRTRSRKIGGGTSTGSCPCTAINGSATRKIPEVERPW